VDELWSDDFEVWHWVVLTKRLPVSDLADSPRPTAPRPDRPDDRGQRWLTEEIHLS
jgi:hypothetical protein